MGTKSPWGTESVPLLRDLHWLPIKQRILYKILLLIHKSIHRCTPVYLCNLLNIHNITYTTRQSNSFMLEYKTSNYHRIGDRSFSVSAPIAWNKLPASLRTIDNFNVFKSKLKTYLFDLTFN